MQTAASHLYRKPEDKTYLLSHSVGLMPSSSESILKEAFLDVWHQAGDQIWPHWLDSIGQFKSALADLFKTDSHSFCPQANVSSGLVKVVNALPRERGKSTILISENDFPSTSFVLQQVTKLGYKIRSIPKHLDHQDINVWSDHINEDVACVFITHVHYNTCQLIPVSGISAIARKNGAITVVDIAQSAGIVPIDISAWCVDIVLGSCIKWLCGGPGAGFLWVDQRLIQTLKPTDVGWFSHQNPFEFDVSHFEYAEDSQRFWGGTPSVLPFVIAANSIRQQLKLGIEGILQHNQALCQKVIESIGENDVVSPIKHEKRGGTLVIRPKRQDLVLDRLADAGVLCDAREYGIRLSPHIYNNEEDIKKVINCLSNNC